MEQHQENRARLDQFNRLFRESNKLYHNLAVKLSLSDSAITILYMLCQLGDGCLQKDICEQSCNSKQTINSAIRKLESENIVFLEKHGGKAKIVCLTDEGRAYTKQTAGKLFEAECSAFRDWSEEEIRLYLRLIEKHSATLRKQIQNL